MLLNKELLEQYCNIIFSQRNISPEYVEKDFYAVSLLKEITSNANNVIFKGGTCLSKCFKIINRFSEDVDLSIIEEHLSESKRRKLVHETIEGSIKQMGLQQKTLKIFVQGELLIVLYVIMINLTLLMATQSNLMLLLNLQ